MSGEVVAGRYLLREAIGRGGMGTVWRAEDRLLGRSVALKQVELPAAVPPQERQAMRQRVFREARAAARLSHASAVMVFDVLEDDGKLFIAMELVEGATLSELVGEHGPLPHPRVATIGLQLLEALEAAHAKGIVHRDVKPGNVIVTDDGRAKLADFGVASVKGDPRLTATGLVLGSPSYMSPEQARGEAAGPASDLWALGATLYFAVEGHVPFERGGALPTLVAVLNEEPPPPRQAGPLAEPILSLLSKDPALRPGPGALRPLLERAGRADARNHQETIPIPVGSRSEAAQRTEPPEPAEQSEPAQQTEPREPAEQPEPAQQTEPPEPAEQSEPAQPAEPAWMAIPATAEEPIGEPPRSEAPDQTREATTQAAEEQAEGPRELQEPPVTSSAPAPAQPLPPARDARGFSSPYVRAGLALVAIVCVGLLFWSQADRLSAPRPAPPSNPPSPSAGARSTPAREQPQAGPAALPGWRTYRIPGAGYRIAYPGEWRVVENAIGDGSSVRFQGESGKYLLVDWTNTPGQDAVAAWRALAAGFSKQHENYHQIRIEPTTFRDFRTAAIWEYSYRADGTDLHAIDFGFANDKRGFALNFQTSEKDWASSQELFERFKQAFQGEQ